MYSKLTEEIVLGDFNTPSELIEWWGNYDFPVNWEVWVPFLFGKNGFCLLDRALIHELRLGRLFIESWATSNIEAQLADNFFSQHSAIALRRDSSPGKGAMLRYIQGGFYQSNLPNWQGLGERAEVPFFSDQYFLFEEETFDEILTLANAPNYLQGMKQSGHRFKIGKTEFLIVSRHSTVSGKSISDLASFFWRTLGYPDPPRDPIILWENYSSDDDRKSLISEVWHQHFTGIFVPYDRKRRLKSYNGARL